MPKKSSTQPSMHTRSSRAKLVAYNSLALATMLLGCELALGDWHELLALSKKDALITKALRGKVKIDNVKALYNDTQDIFIKYTRDDDGYRSRARGSDKDIILTIGGSTTDQRFVTDGKTWQDELDKVFPSFDFINGGVDGQSTFGHIHAVNHWHARKLDARRVKAIIVYFGINDRRLLHSNLNSFDKPLKPMDYIHVFGNQYSFFYRKLTAVRDRIVGSSVNMSGHGTSRPDFLPIPKGKPFSEEDKDYSYYKALVQSLISSLEEHFPASKIILVQQQVPGCKFTSKFSGTDIHDYSINSSGVYALVGEENICQDLASVYKSQDETLNKRKGDLIEKMPMYLESDLSSGDLYDLIHTKPSGSLKIAEYLTGSIFLKGLISRQSR